MCNSMHEIMHLRLHAGRPVAGRGALQRSASSPPRTCCASASRRPPAVGQRADNRPARRARLALPRLPARYRELKHMIIGGVSTLKRPFECQVAGRRSAHPKLRVHGPSFPTPSARSRGAGRKAPRPTAAPARGAKDERAEPPGPVAEALGPQGRVLLDLAVFAVHHRDDAPDRGATSIIIGIVGVDRAGAWPSRPSTSGWRPIF